MATLERAYALEFQVPRRPVYYATKRVLDVLVAVTVLLVLLPVFAAIGLGVKITSPGPVMFGHVRCGQNGRPFTCWKVRTMYHWPAADALAKYPQLTEEFGREFKLRDDPRVTRVGRFLRRSSLDEVPQLWNVIRGEMSIVGPRPVLEREISEMYGPVGPIILSVRPGLTGLWQVSGRSALSYPERVALDLEYVRRQSTLLDLSLMSRTPVALITMRGAV